MNQIYHRRKIEPFYTVWIGIVDEFQENYIDLENIKFLNLIKYMNGNELKILKNLEGNYLCWIDHYNMDKEIVPMDTMFLSVRYKCDKTNLFLDIPKEFFMDKNVLFSKEFIKWWIDYRVGNRVHYNSGYTLEIMDDNLDCFVLNSQQYVLLGKNGNNKKYTIVQRK